MFVPFACRKACREGVIHAVLQRLLQDVPCLASEVSGTLSLLACCFAKSELQPRLGVGRRHDAIGAQMSGIPHPRSVVRQSIPSLARRDIALKQRNTRASAGLVSATGGGGQARRPARCEIVGTLLPSSFDPGCRGLHRVMFTTIVALTSKGHMVCLGKCSSRRIGVSGVVARRLGSQVQPCFAAPPRALHTRHTAFRSAVAAGRARARARNNHRECLMRLPPGHPWSCGESTLVRGRWSKQLCNAVGCASSETLLLLACCWCGVHVAALWLGGGKALVGRVVFARLRTLRAVCSWIRVCKASLR